MVDRTESSRWRTSDPRDGPRRRIYELLSELRTAGRRFVIRVCKDGWVQGEGRLFTAVVSAPVLLDREVKLSRRTKSLWTTKGRGHPAREERTAKLAISSRSVTLRRPKTTTANHPSELTVNVVNVNEPAPPDGEPPVQWLLLTSEAVDSGGAGRGCRRCLSRTMAHRRILQSAENRLRLRGPAATDHSHTDQHAGRPRSHRISAPSSAVADNARIPTLRLPPSSSLSLSKHSPRASGTSKSRRLCLTTRPSLT